MFQELSSFYPKICHSNLKHGFRIRDPEKTFPDPGSMGQKGTGSGFASSVADPGSGMGESQHPGPGSGLNNQDNFLDLRNHFFAFFEVKILKFFEDPGSGMETVRIRDPGSRMGKSRIRDKHPGSATLSTTLIAGFGVGFAAGTII